MSTETENAQKMGYDSSTSVVSSSHALRLGMPKLGRKAVFFYGNGNEIFGCEFVKNEDHAKLRLAAHQKTFGDGEKLTLLVVEPRVTSRELRGSTGRPKPYTVAKPKGAKIANAEKMKKAA